MTKAKKKTDKIIVINEPIEPVIVKPEVKQIKDRLSIVANQYVNFMGKITLERDIPVSISTEEFTKLMNEIPTFEQMIKIGIITVR